MDKARTKSGNLTNVVAYALIGCIAFVVMKFEFPELGDNINEWIHSL